jgi:hypothetical protein
MSRDALDFICGENQGAAWAKRKKTPASRSCRVASRLAEKEARPPQLVVVVVVIQQAFRRGSRRRRGAPNPQLLRNLPLTLPLPLPLPLPLALPLLLLPLLLVLTRT